MVADAYEQFPVKKKNVKISLETLVLDLYDDVMHQQMKRLHEDLRLRRKYGCCDSQCSNFKCH
jgi:hypothetical protein